MAKLSPEKKNASSNTPGSEHIQNGPETGRNDSFPSRRDSAFGRKTILLGVLGVVILSALVIHASLSNRSNYYLKAFHGAVEICRGRFAPLGETLIVSLPGAQLPKSAKTVYSKEEAFEFAFNYFVERADLLLESPDMPDLEGVRSYLNRALSFAETNLHRRAVYTRLNSIDLLTFLYKADVAASKGTLSDLEAAREYLDEAASLDLDDSQTELIKKKIEMIKMLRDALEAKQP